MIRRPPRSTLSSSSAASDVYKRQVVTRDGGIPLVSHAYAGDRLDVTQFSTVITELIARYRELVLSATLGEDDRVVVGRHDEDGFLRSCAAPWWRGTGFGQVTGGATARV